MMNNTTMVHKIFILILSLFFYCHIGSSSEISTLLSIKQSLIDPLNRLQEWELPKNIVENTSTHCNWIGVSCNSNGFIDKLDISNWNLSGTISDQIENLRTLTSLNLCCNMFSSPLPKSILNLTELEFFDFSQNSFSESFPGEFSEKTRLKTLNASGNNFSGEIPENLRSLLSLETLDLRGNGFRGLIPKWFRNFKELKYLGLSGNSLFGKLPEELGELSSLETMVIGYNTFEGEIPKEFGNLTNLRYLDLAVSNLSGTIPADLGKLILLDTIFVYKNNFDGKIPKEIGNLSRLQELDFSDNMLSGEIPGEITELKNLRLLNLMCNELSGSIPVGLSELTRLEVFALWNNSLSGPLPSELGRNSPLQWLDISSNSFSGQIPSTLCDKGNLTKLIIFNNEFSGNIPMELSTCHSLVRVRMQNNLLSGTIPLGFGQLQKLQRLELANNSLIGKIPSDISSSFSISFIDFSQNKLESSLPSLILSMTNLQTFSASKNDLFGVIPDQFQDCPSLSVLDLSYNRFTGSIPASIASCEKMVALNLGSNFLTGPIPNSIAKMPTLSVLDLSNNSLTGNLPENFGNSPALEMLNVSHNKLEGHVPNNGMLRTINPDDLIGNVGLCGGVLPPCAYSEPYKHAKLHKKHVIAGYVIGFSSLLGMLVLFFGAKFIYRRWYSNGSCFEERLEMGRGSWPWRLLAFQRVKFTTNDVLSCIKESNVIGMGATGTVYKAEISRLNLIVAVKKLWKMGTDIETRDKNGDLVGEVNVLGRLKHRNIVKLLGFVHNDKDAMIIYEYMQNGSLGEALHGKQKGCLLVDWVSRYNIALGIAQGLAYLHHDCHPLVIHRDIKSKNILLDVNFDAKVADFGLARMMIKQKETVSMVAGSYGYIAPEYGYTLKVDEKSDVYSYGVVLMELLTTKRPLEPEFGESVDIVEWIRNKIRDNKCLEETLDPNMGNLKHVKEEMLLVLRIALLCTAKLPKDRPSMRDVISMLEEAKPRRKGSVEVDKEKPVFSTSPVNGLIH